MKTKTYSTKRPIPSEDLDWAVAVEVFGIAEEILDRLPWGVPKISEQHGLAMRAVEWICFSEPHRLSFERNLRELLPTHSGTLFEQLMITTPELLSFAAVMAVRECGAVGSSRASNMGSQSQLEADRTDCRAAIAQTPVDGSMSACPPVSQATNG